VFIFFLVDEKLYSRQLYVMGHEAQKRMMESSAYLIGLSGLGIEIAKNIVLAGISKVYLHDDDIPNVYDLGGNFYITPKDLDDENNSNKGRAEICRDALAALNPYVQVVRIQPSTHPSSSSSSSSNNTVESILEGLKTYTPTVCVITIPFIQADIIALNEYCRQHSIRFIYALSMSVFGMTFCDFGNEFVVSDKDGENPAVSQIESIVLPDVDNANITIKVLEDQGRHGLENGDQVQFNRLKDVPLDPKQTYPVHVTGPFTFEIDGKYVLKDNQNNNNNHNNSSGYITQVKQPITISFESYATKLANLGDNILLSDFAKFDRPKLLHAGFQAVMQYYEQHQKQLPKPGDMQAAQHIYQSAMQIIMQPTSSSANNDDQNHDPDVQQQYRRILYHLASGSRAMLSPMCAAMGGLVGQEVLKACSGKFTPIQGFFYLDADETLPDEILSPEQLTIIDSNNTNDTDSIINPRYASSIAVFGKDMQKRIQDLRYFLIGAGAIGCEMLKNWALMGVGCGAAGHVYVTDMDRIEKSNLSRQFLFRNSDIDGFKSTIAAEAAQAMNPDLRITAYQEKVAAETEYLFGDDFYDKLSGVCTALDNVEARLYVDQRCLFYRLPMLESGTLGTKGNTQIVVPHVTENYGATRDPPEKSIPVCTLKNFPNQIQHTLQWARDWFEGEFKHAAEEVNQYLSTPTTTYLESLQPNSRSETFRLLQRVLKDERPANFEDCVAWARLTFEKLFHNQISQLLFNFPADQVTANGTKFWSGSKRCPKPLDFDVDTKDEDAGMRNHLDFVVAAANLRAEMYGIRGRTDEEYFRTVLHDVIVPDFSPAEGVKIAANDEEAEEDGNGTTNNVSAMDTDDAEDLWNSLPKPDALAGFRLTPIEFDKDIDEHMLFVTACSNLRALNYSIPTEDTHRSRAIAGRIIPAIATTTACTYLLSFRLFVICVGVVFFIRKITMTYHVSNFASSFFVSKIQSGYGINLLGIVQDCGNTSQATENRCVQERFCQLGHSFHDVVRTDGTCQNQSHAERKSVGMDGLGFSRYELG
jgi:ubiquitin-activating enzyme E1